MKIRSGKEYFSRVITIFLFLCLAPNQAGTEIEILTPFETIDEQFYSLSTPSR